MNKNKKQKILKKYRHKLDWHVDSNALIIFQTWRTLRKGAFKPDSVLEQPLVALFILLLCGLLDFAMFYQLFSNILYSAPFVRWLSVIGCLLVFDFGPVYLGEQLKAGYQGLKENKAVEVALVIAFVLVFIGNLWLRIRVKDLLVADTSAMGMSSIYQSVISDGSSAAMAYAIFSSFLPLTTSIVSGCIGFTCSNPLLSKLAHLYARQTRIEESIVHKKALLKEYDGIGNCQERLIEYNNKMYQIALNKVEDIAGLFETVMKAHAETELPND